MFSGRMEVLTDSEGELLKMKNTVIYRVYQCFIDLHSLVINNSPALI